MRRLAVYFAFLLIVTGCYPGANEGGHLSRSQVLNLNPDADLIELEDGDVYTQGAEWVKEKGYQKGEKLGEVKKGMATKAPVGADIYKTKENSPVIIVEYNGLSKMYLLAMGE
ncbi:hypothetical protein SAMN05216353_10211 [Halobacillus alkaliphilus]|uniref:Lipoprotein n=1 Tax=Halobacillus alkaliphilus TaxID=396056 RepID=A0A1I2JVR7_9BACI|nr:hypothetical protein [Halobacillus alkaliphilus]SFF56891.1 hypothetical protein SAMN05216353_10211 [Halobacillus alkaliphilus]